jgi:hypothetical protein
MKKPRGISFRMVSVPADSDATLPEQKPEALTYFWATSSLCDSFV